jgi:hypothetical protein
LQGLQYLSGVIAYLEDKYGLKPWQSGGKDYETFDEYIEKCGVKSFQIWALSSSKIEALVCIRDATTHNGGDLAKSRDEEILGKVQSADIPNINLNVSANKPASSH